MKCVNCTKNPVSNPNKEYCPECQQKLDNITEDELRKMYEWKHEHQDYGKSSEHLLHFLDPIIGQIAPKSILDFGCGQSNIINMLSHPIQKRAKYDFAIPEHSILPDGQFDLVLCTDVLEHVPEKMLDNFLKKVKSKGEKVIFRISCVPAVQFIGPEVNCHCTLKTTPEWIKLLQNYWKNVTIIEYGNLEYEVICKTW